MLALIIGVLLIPIYRDIQQQAEGQAALNNVRAARAVFAALQAARVERGPTRITLEGSEPASAEFIAVTSKVRASSEPAFESVLHQCIVIDCAGPKKEVFAGLSGSISKLKAIRLEVDVALRVPLKERRRNIASDFNVASTDVVRGHAMKLTGSEFRLFVDECLACAREATTDECRRQHLAMAKMWSTAAGRLEDNGNASQIGRRGEGKNPTGAWESDDH